MQAERRYNFVPTLRSIRTALPVMHSTTQSESLPSASKRRNNVEQRPVYAFPPMEHNNVTTKETEVKKKVVTKPKLPLSRPAVAASQPMVAAAPQLPIRNDNVSVPTETVTESAQEKLSPAMQDNDDDDDGVEVWVQEEVQEEKDESPPARKEENDSSQPRLQEQAAANGANENEGLEQDDTTTTTTAAAAAAAAALDGNDEVLPDNPDVATQVTLETKKAAAPPQTKTEQLPEPQSQSQQSMISKTSGGDSFTAFMKQSQPAANPTPAFDPESIDIDTISAQIHERKQQKLGMKNDSSAQELLPDL